MCSQGQGCVPLILAFERLKQDSKFQTSLGYIIQALSQTGKRDRREDKSTTLGITHWQGVQYSWRHSGRLPREEGPPACSDLRMPLPQSSSSIMNVPGESTLRREFLRLQQENKSNSEALKQQQQQQLQQQQRDPEAHIKHLLHQRQRRIEEQKEERRRVEEVGPPGQEEK